MDTSIERTRDTRLDDTKNNVSNISTNTNISSSSSSFLVSPSESVPRPSSFPIQSGNPFPPPPLRAPTITAIANDMTNTYKIIASQSTLNTERFNQNSDNPTLTGVTEKLNQGGLNENENENVRGNVNVRQNVNEDIRENENANFRKNENVNFRQNVNEDIRENENVNFRQNVNENVNVGQTANENVRENVNENVKENENVNINENDTTENQFLQKPLLPSKKFKIEVSLQNACQSLRELFSLSNTSNQSHLFSKAKGIMFLSVVKGGIGIGGSLGSGVILARKNNKWSNPCAIGLTGLQIGFDIGIERVDNVLLLRDELTLKMFQNKTTLNIGSDISIAAGPSGGELKIGVVVDDNMSTTNIYSYSIAKGVYVGLSLNGSWIKIRDDWNEEFYGREISGKEIISSYDDASVANNSEYSSLIHLLNEYCGTD